MRWPFVNYPVLMNIHYYSISTTWPRIHIIACCCRQKTIKKCVIDFIWLLIKKKKTPSPHPPSLTRKGYIWVNSRCTYMIFDWFNIVVVNMFYFVKCNFIFHISKLLFSSPICERSLLHVLGKWGILVY